MRDDYEFEYDPDKSRANAAKHGGITLGDAEAIWDDPLFAEVHLQSFPEERWAVIGRVGKNRHMTAIVTRRGDTVRIISARWSTKKEVDVYDRH